MYAPYSGEEEYSQCLSYYTLAVNKCILCAPPYIASDGKNCFLEDFKCNEYDQIGSCVKCVDGYILFGSKQKYCIKESIENPN